MSGDSSAERGRFFYGWWIVGGCFVTLFFLFGMVINTLTIFFKPICEDMGWERAKLSVTLAIGALFMALLSPVAGKLIDRFGARLVMTVGTLVIGFGTLVASRATELWHFYIIFGFNGCGLAAATIVPCSLVISNWFTGRRGLAMGIAVTGTSFGGMIMSPVANWIILHYGWRTAFAFSGLVILLAVIPTVLILIRTHPRDMGLQPYGEQDVQVEAATPGGVTLAEALRVPAFWQIGGMMFVFGLLGNGIGLHGIPYLTDIGHSPTLAAFAWSTLMGFMVLGKFGFGYLADRWGPRNSMVVACVMVACSICILAVAKPVPVMFAFAIVYGFAIGSSLTINPLLTTENLGLAHFGTVFGILNLISIVGGAIGPVAMGAIYDARESYLLGFVAFTVLVLISGVAVFFLRPAGSLAQRA